MRTYKRLKEIDDIGLMVGLTTEKGMMSALVHLTCLDIIRINNAMADSLSKTKSKAKKELAEKIRLPEYFFLKHDVNFELVCPISGTGVARISPDTESPRFHRISKQKLKPYLQKATVSKKKNNS